MIGVQWGYHISIHGNGCVVVVQEGFRNSDALRSRMMEKGNGMDASRRASQGPQTLRNTRVKRKLDFQAER